MNRTLTESLLRSSSGSRTPFEVIRLDLCVIFGQLRLDVVGVVIVHTIRILSP